MRRRQTRRRHRRAPVTHLSPRMRTPLDRPPTGRERPTVHKIPIDNLFTSAPSRFTTCPRPQSVPWNRYPSLEDFLGVQHPLPDGWPRYSRTKRESGVFEQFLFLFFLRRVELYRLCFIGGWLMAIGGYWRDTGLARFRF